MARHGGRGTEKGVCILCGKETLGIMANEDRVIRAARKIRALLNMEPRHTVACRSCLKECRVRRRAFEKKSRNYRILAAAFFLLVFVGSMAYGKLELSTIAAAALGTLFIALLPYFYYAPGFENTGGKYVAR